MAALIDLVDVGADKFAKLDMEDKGSGSLHFIWTGTLTATISIWISNVPNPSESEDTEWIDLGLTIPSNPAGSAGKTLLNFTGIGAKWLRVKFDWTSGFGNLTVHSNLKV